MLFGPLDESKVAKMVKFDVTESFQHNFIEQVNIITRYMVGSTGQEIVSNSGMDFDDFINRTLTNTYFVETEDIYGNVDVSIKPYYMASPFAELVNRGVVNTMSAIIDMVEDKQA